MRGEEGQSGFTLVSAIFLMVVLVTLGVSIVTLSSVQHTTTAQQLQSVRANYAARAGLEWAVATANTDCTGLNATLNLAEAALDGFTVTVACAVADHAVGDDTKHYFRFDVTAESGVYPSPDFVSRRLQAKVLNPP